MRERMSESGAFVTEAEMKSPAILPTLKALRMFLIFAGLVTTWHYRVPLSGMMRAMSDWQAIATYIQGYDVLGPIVLSLLVLAQIFVAFIPGHALVVASGYIYGAKMTILVVASSAILGSEIAFWLARKYGRPLIYRLASPAAIERWDQLAGNRSATFYFFTFVLPFLPSDMMCYVAGLGKVPGRRFFAANVAGRLLSTVAMTLIGVFKLQPPVGFWLLFAGGLAVLYIAWGFYSKTFEVFRSKKNLARACERLIMKTYKALFGLRHRIYGLEDLPPGPKILAANHPNASDGIQLPLAFMEQVTIIAQESLFRLPFIGWILTHAGHVPVRVGQQGAAFEQACKAISEGRSILIFPEGKLNPDKKKLKVGSGAVRMSLSTGAPIVPIGIYVTERDTIKLRDPFRKFQSGRWQFRGNFIGIVGKAWMPALEVPHGANPVEIRKLTRLLIGKINFLVQQAAQEAAG